jgi:hypothetical protein
MNNKLLLYIIMFPTLMYSQTVQTKPATQKNYDQPWVLNDINLKIDQYGYLYDLKTDKLLINLLGNNPVKSEEELSIEEADIIEKINYLQTNDFILLNIELISDEPLGYFFKLDKKSKKILWKKDINGPDKGIVEGNFFYLNSFGWIHKFNLTTGVQVWKTDLSNYSFANADNFIFENNELRIGFYPWNEHDSCKLFLIIDKITGKFGLITPRL